MNISSLLSRPKPYLELKQCILNLKSGTSFSGVVFRTEDKWLVVKGVTFLQDRNNKLTKGIKLDGEVLIQVNEIDFIQVT